MHDSSNPSSAAVNQHAQRGRVIGRLSGAPGPTMIIVAGIHGNEPAGSAACHRVLRGLKEAGLPLRGELVALAGNLTAIEANARFIDRDLNRQWTPERVAALRRARPAPGCAVEDREQWELLDTLERILQGAAGPVYLLDLHTSSAEGPPFVTVGDTLRNRRFALKLPLPIILGLEEQVDGSLLEFLNTRGTITVGVEGGQHDAPRSVDHHEAVLWLALVAARMLPEDEVHGLERHWHLLEQAGPGVPHVVEVRRRHAIRDSDKFQMLRGFTNFQPISRGQELACDRQGMICSPEDGMILLPLYQGLGDDGFFVAREVRRFWLRLSALLRLLRLDRLMAWLPGVRRHPDRADVLVVDTRIARWYPLEIFHLFGFRKLRHEGDELLVSRRPYDLFPPPQISF